MVNPRDKLPAVAGAAAEATSDPAEKRVEGASRIRAHRDRGPKRDLPRRNGRLIERQLPRAGDVDAESPGVRRIGLLSAEDTRHLVVRCVVPMRIDCGGARLQPDT